MQLSVIDSLMPWTYVRQILYFPSRDPLLVQTLRDALILTLKDVPYLACRIHRKESAKGRVALTDARDSIDNLFLWQDRSDVINYSDLKADNFPSPDPTSALFIPPETSPPFPDPAPVFRAHVTLVNGGCLVCVAVHHCTTDITGFGALLKIWATNCRTGSLDSIGFSPSWLDRTVLKSSPAVKPDMPGHLHIRTPEDKMRLRAGPPGVEYEMLMFRFPQASLERLKQESSQDLKPHGVDWLSTNDVLTALLWTAITAAEVGSEAEGAHDRVSTLGIPVNFRTMLQPTLPKDYLGAAIGKATVTLPISDLLEAAKTGSAQRLTPIAAAVRRSILKVDAPSIWSILSYLEAQDDLTSIQLGPQNDGNSIVSWADEGVYELDWGEAVGRCDSVRAQKLSAKRYPIVFPRLQPQPGDMSSGGLEVLVSLEKDIMTRLTQSALINEYAVVEGA